MALSSDPTRFFFALLAVSHVFSIARRVTVPIVMTCGRMMPHFLPSSCGGEIPMSTLPCLVWSWSLSCQTTICFMTRSRAEIQ